MDVLLYATGSPIIVDVEESLRRAGHSLAAGVRNRETQCFVRQQSRSISLDEVSAGLKAIPFLVPLFTPAHRLTAAAEARSAGFLNPFSLIDPTAVKASDLRLGPGSYVGAGVTIGACSVLGRFAFVNRSASIGHHFIGGDFVSIGPGAVLAGKVQIGSGGVLGAGSVVLPSVAIGAGAIVAAGAVVSRDVPAACLVAGNPARRVRSDLPHWADRERAAFAGTAAFLSTE